MVQRASWHVFLLIPKNSTQTYPKLTSAHILKLTFPEIFRMKVFVFLNFLKFFFRLMPGFLRSPHMVNSWNLSKFSENTSQLFGQLSALGRYVKWICRQKSVYQCLLSPRVRHLKLAFASTLLGCWPPILSVCSPLSLTSCLDPLPSGCAILSKESPSFAVRPEFFPWLPDALFGIQTWYTECTQVVDEQFSHKPTLNDQSASCWRISNGKIIDKHYGYYRY